MLEPEKYEGFGASQLSEKPDQPSLLLTFLNLVVVVVIIIIVSVIIRNIIIIVIVPVNILKNMLSPEQRNVFT